MMDEEEPPSKKARIEISPEHQPKKLLGLVDHQYDPPSLPSDWIAVPHISGMTVYLHRPTRVVTLSRPYHVSTSNTIKKHNVYVQSIPCMEQWLFNGNDISELAQTWHREAGEGKQGKLIKIAKLLLKHSQYRIMSSLAIIDANHMTQYLSLHWDTAQLNQQQSTQEERGKEGEKEGGKDGESVRKGKKAAQSQQKKQLNPLIPEGLSKVVKIRIPTDYRKIVQHIETKKPPAVWEVNMAHKNAITILYEFCQLYLHTSPDFTFPDTRGSPYKCEVKVGGVRYGSGEGANKKIAKMTAAGATMEIFLPGAFPPDQLIPHEGTSSLNDTRLEESLQLLSQVPIDDPQARSMLVQTGFPSPWQTLRNTLLWNHEFLSDKLTIDYQPLPEARPPSIPADHQFECILQCGEGEGEGEVGDEERVKIVKITCVGRRDGQSMAAQAMLKKIHPCINNWGSLLRLYNTHHPSQSSSTTHDETISPVVKGCGLLSGADQQLLHTLRQSMLQLAKQREEEEEEPTSLIDLTDLHQSHIRLTSHDIIHH